MMHHILWIIDYAKTSFCIYIKWYWDVISLMSHHDFVLGYSRTEKSTSFHAYGNRSFFWKHAHSVTHSATNDDLVPHTSFLHGPTLIIFIAPIKHNFREIDRTPFQLKSVFLCEVDCNLN